MGGQNGNLTDAQVKKIRKLAIEGKLTFKDIGDKLGIHMTHARSVAIGNSYAHVDGPRAPLRTKPRKPRTRIRTDPKKKKATKASTNGRVEPVDLTHLTVDDAARLLQALSHEWPKIRAAFLLLDSILTGEADDGS